MKLIAAGVLAAAGLFAVPASSFAAMYQYIDFRGFAQEHEADTAMEALVMPNDIAAHSGVMLINDTDEAIPTSMQVPL